MLEKRRKGSGTKTKEATEEKRKGAQIKNVNMIAIPINFWGWRFRMSDKKNL